MLIRECKQCGTLNKGSMERCKDCHSKLPLNGITEEEFSERIRKARSAGFVGSGGQIFLPKLAVGVS